MPVTSSLPLWPIEGSTSRPSCLEEALLHPEVQRRDVGDRQHADLDLRHPALLLGARRPAVVATAGEREQRRRDDPCKTPAHQPHTSFAVSTINRSFAACCSRESALPSTVEEKPHCGDRHSWSTSTYCDASSILRLSVVLGLELAALGGDEPEHDLLALRDEPQRLEAARARVVPLHEEAVDLELAEQRLGDEVVAALGDPRGAEVAAAHVRRDRHALGSLRERLVDVGDVGLVQVLDVAAALRGDHLALARVVEVGEARVVELQVACSRARRGAGPPRRRPR